MEGEAMGKCRPAGARWGERCRAQGMEGGPSLTQASSRPRPVEREVLAGAAGPAQLEAEHIDLVLARRGVGRDLARANLGAGRVVDRERRSGLVGPTSAFLPPLAVPGTSRANPEVLSSSNSSGPTRSRALLDQLGQSSRPAAASPPKIDCRASRWDPSARSSMKTHFPVLRLAHPDVPFELATATTFRSSSLTSPSSPWLTCQARMPLHSFLVRRLGRKCTRRAPGSDRRRNQSPVSRQLGPRPRRPPSRCSTELVRAYAFARRRADTPESTFHSTLSPISARPCTRTRPGGRSVPGALPSRGCPG